MTQRTPHDVLSSVWLLFTLAFLAAQPTALAALTISNVEFIPEDHRITVRWTTNEPANTGLYYSDPFSSGSYVINESVTQHAPVMESLFPATDYLITVRSVNGAGIAVSSGPYAVRTLADTTSPTVSRMTLHSVGSHSAAISWTADEASTGMVDYGQTLAYGATASAVPEPVRLSGLSAFTNYQFRVRAVDNSGNSSVGLGNFTLATDTLWSQYTFQQQPRLYYTTCAAVGDASGCEDAYAYDWPKEMSWTGNELLIHFNAAADDLARGGLELVVSAAFVQPLGGEWVSLQVAAGSQPESLSVVGPEVTMDRSGVYRIPVSPSLLSPGLNYIRLRATNISPEEMGYGKSAPVVVWDRMELRFAQRSAPALSDAQLLDRTEAQAARYFWEQAFLTNGFVRDLTNAQEASMASTGFGLAALVAMAERYGTSAEWTVTPAQARARAQLILDAAVAIQAKQAGDPNRYGKAGFLYHFVEPDGQRYRNLPPGQLPGDSAIEVSTIDTALFVAGALTAGRYFGGTVQERADQFFNTLAWEYFFNPQTQRFHHAWKPDYVEGYLVPAPDGHGYLSTQEWDRPTDEILLISLLALARTPAHAGFAASLYAWPRVARTYAGYTVVNSFFGSLFSYIFGHGFFDFSAMGPDNPASVGAPVPSVDWFENSRRATLANRQFAMDQAANVPTYSAERWGLSACFRPNGAYFGDNGASPVEVDDGVPRHDGIVPPYASISAMPLVRTSASESLAQNLAFQALRHYHDQHYARLWGPYGPKDSLEIQPVGTQVVPANSPLYVGIDVGPELVMLENYRSGLIQRWFMDHPAIRTAVRAQFPNAQLNRAPTMAALSPRTVAETQALSVIVNATDPDGDALTYSAAQLPSGAAFNAATRTLSWTPAIGQAGAYTVSFIATDPGGLSASTDLAITVTPSIDFGLTHNPPRPDVTLRAGDTGITQVDLWHLVGYPVVSFSVSGLPAGVTAAVSPSSCQPNCSPSVTMTTSAGTPTGTSTITVTGTSGTVTRSTSFLLTVNPPPVAPQTPWQTNAYGTLYLNQSGHYARGYHFTPLKTGRITGLGGYFYGAKVVKLFNRSTGALLASTTIASSSQWAFVPITPVTVSAGAPYTVAVYLAGSGGSRRSGLSPALPRTFGDIRIDASTYIYTGSNPAARPTNAITGTMYGQVDIQFTPVETPWQMNANGTLYNNINYYYAMGYHFTPVVNGQVTALGGFFNGVKVVKLFNKATGQLLASATVSAANTWGYASIVPVSVSVGTTYTVAVYLAGSGGSVRTGVTPRFPTTHGSIRIEGSTFVKTSTDPSARPTNTAAPYMMYGQADIQFAPD